MAYCPKCGNKVDETMAFCPRCGASVGAAGVASAPQPQYQRREKSEKQEKQEKGEKQEKNEPEKSEKHEKGEFSFIGWLIGGLILIFIGSLYFLNLHFRLVNTTTAWALLLLVIGVVIIAVGAYLGIKARRQNPQP
ncbi:MAG: zinc-ribbon domain-containing protein [Candidatus Bathyarchaeota archaeon]|nr:zinc-ribbon domain-containing protein [Candidatus Bathyarchaeota archaeon]